MRFRFSPLLAVALALGLGAGAPGCYYGHLAVGQAKVLAARRPIEEVLADPETDPALRDALSRVEETRAFATSLGLDVAGQYTSYVEWPGDRLVTTVVATRPGEVEAHPFEFPIVGRVPYKGYFDAEAARGEAERLRGLGMDTCLVPVTAYSTLGWLDDPVTSPMLGRADDEFVEILLHELVHATVYIESQPDFNEGVARFLGEEAAVRFFRRSCEAGRPCPADEVRARVDDDRLVAETLLRFRERVARLYEREKAPDLRAVMRAELEAEARAQIADLPLRVRPATAIAESLRLGDACMALRGTYSQDLRAHARLLESLDGDLAGFVLRLRQAAEAQDPRDAFFGGPS